MNALFYPKLAAGGIRKNYRLYVPYIFTCTGMVMMYYIIEFLSMSKTLELLPGGWTIKSMLELGGWVIALFACLFLFYTNSFLVRRRKMEFGLYNILGMGKWNIARILIWESLIIAFVSLWLGLLLGVTLSKLAELGVVYIMHGEVTYTMSVSPAAILMTLMVFGVIFLLLLLNSIRQVRFSTAISLLRSENAGEKPPRANWVLGLGGVGLLGGAYYLAVTIRDPLVALMLFFIAVSMVIVGTYLVMISGSVLLCRILQKNKNYYYKPNHFVSVSSMAYRMKRNGAGLASVCILATMVLVMLSSTTCLYFGEEDAILTRYPRQIGLLFHAEDPEDLTDRRAAALRAEIDRVCAQQGVTPLNGYAYRSAVITGLLQGDRVETDVRAVEDSITNGVYNFYFVPLADYNATMGTAETLAPGEALVYSWRGGPYTADAITFGRETTFRVKKQLDAFPPNGDMTMDIMSSLVFVVPDITDSLGEINTMADFNGDRMLHARFAAGFDTELSPEGQIALRNALGEALVTQEAKDAFGYSSVALETQAGNREDFFGIFGGLLYLGIILSVVFIIAAVLIVYYKQISEGYEDQARFEIMQKVGMTRYEIRRSINSQLLTVFFLPLIFAAMHLAFAFPIIRKLLLLFNLSNAGLFALTSVICVGVFALFYTLVYRLTSNAYYNIVSGARDER